LNTRETLNVINEDGCIRLIDAVFWSSIVDIVNGWRYFQNHPDEALVQNRRYCSAVAFLRGSNRGQRILSILNRLDDDQRAALIDKGGLAASYKSKEYEVNDEYE
jgi:hypothetical protein